MHVDGRVWVEVTLLTHKLRNDDATVVAPFTYVNLCYQQPVCLAGNIKKILSL